VKNSIISFFIVVSLFGLTACETNAQRGTITGGLVGGAVGNQIGDGKGRVAAIIIGTLIGAALGNQVGTKMDVADRMQEQAALENNRTNQASSWVNPDTQTEYSVTPQRTYVASSGKTCREYTTTVYIEGRAETGKGTACRNQAGEWVIN
jgi:surface antigen